MNLSKDRKSLIHGKEVILNKKILDAIIAEKSTNYKAFHTELVEQYGLDLQYKSFMSLIHNRYSWKLMYAWIIAEHLEISMEDIFQLVAVDKEKRQQEIDEWYEKYMG